MKTVEIITLSNGYYVRKVVGCNVEQKYCKTLADAEALKRKWSK